ncbi:MAG: phosphoribosyltransferase family protein [Candidatus Peribacteraceae bacterium]|jgi:predicted phosphoribosyltransferase|nr:phosphoribosyltransferase family protein [Candidatus Peribacteraceae bacterium]HCI04086.1 phosphoribosyltransferase [Candidatus Peribacteria bacterium]|tara:strand:- start:146 stop:781 length:636 start_codon:yes stop_codon:yes gene_type:complete
MSSLPFASRTEAGTLLAKELESYKESEDTLVLALVRGGVVVGSALSKELSLPLFPYIVRKIGHPEHREFAVGAIAEGGATYLDDKALQMHSVGWDDVEEVIEEEQVELMRREEAYLIKARPDLEGKTVILTDDGAATGSTIYAAIDDLRNAKVKKLIVALPVCPPDTGRKLKEKTDEAYILAEPEDFYAVGQFYKKFDQVNDEDVLRILRS